MKVLLPPQASDVNAPQVPEKSCSRICDGADETVIVCVVACATKVYHTSDLLVAPQPIVAPGKVEGLYVAFTLVPPVFTQLDEELSAIAPEHSSLAG